MTGAKLLNNKSFSVGARLLAKGLIRGAGMRPKLCTTCCAPPNRIPPKTSRSATNTPLRHSSDTLSWPGTNLFTTRRSASRDNCVSGALRLINEWLRSAARAVAALIGFVKCGASRFQLYTRPSLKVGQQGAGDLCGWALPIVRAPRNR